MFYKRFIVLYNIPQRVYFCLNRVGFCTSLSNQTASESLMENSINFQGEILVKVLKKICVRKSI